jgi:hypothetical protein
MQLAESPYLIAGDLTAAERASGVKDLFVSGRLAQPQLLTRGRHLDDTHDFVAPLAAQGSPSCRRRPRRTKASPKQRARKRTGTGPCRSRLCRRFSDFGELSRAATGVASYNRDEPVPIEVNHHPRPGKISSDPARQKAQTAGQPMRPGRDCDSSGLNCPGTRSYPGSSGRRCGRTVGRGSWS